MKYTLAFDVYGTLINTSGVFNTLDKMIGAEATSIMEVWRNKQLEYSFRRGLMGVYVDFSICTKEALDYSCAYHNCKLNNNQKASLLKEYTVLPLFPEVMTGLTELKKDGHTLYAFSNGSYKAIEKLLSNSGIIDTFNGIVSAEDVNTFKPSPTVYKHFNTKSNSTKSTSWLISSNPFDIIGAANYGMKTAWLQRTQDVVFDPWNMEPTVIISQLTKLSEVIKM